MTDLFIIATIACIVILFLYGIFKKPKYKDPKGEDFINDQWKDNLNEAEFRVLD